MYALKTYVMAFTKSNTAGFFIEFPLLLTGSKNRIQRLFISTTFS